MEEKEIKIDWEKQERGVFLVNTLGIIFNPSTKKILIGRRENDEHIKGLTWSFPGGIPEYGEDLEESIEEAIKVKTGLKVKNLGSVFSRFLEENKKFLVIYYLCEVVSGEEKAGDKFIELKWVDPDELEKYFTTSFDPRLKEYIMGLK